MVHPHGYQRHRLGWLLKYHCLGICRVPLVLLCSFVLLFNFITSVSCRFVLYNFESYPPSYNPPLASSKHRTSEPQHPSEIQPLGRVTDCSADCASRIQGRGKSGHQIAGSTLTY